MIDKLLDHIANGVIHGLCDAGTEPCPECDGEEQEAEREESDDYSTPCHLCNGTGRVPMQ